MEKTMPQGDLIHPSIRGKLRRLGSAIRARLLGEGLAWLGLALVALVLGTLGLDYVMHLLHRLARSAGGTSDLALRVVFMLLGLIGVVWVAWRRLVRPLRVWMDPQALTLLVEHRWRQLGDRLISALQFSGRADLAAVGFSQAMVDRVAVEANRMADPLNFGELVERRSLGRLALIAAGAFALLAGFSIWRPDVMKLWFQRNVMFAAVDWPQDTYLEVQGDSFAVVSENDLWVRVVVREGVTPDYVEVHKWQDKGRVETSRFFVDPNEAGLFSIEFKKVTRSFNFYVTGGDDALDSRQPHRVRVVDPPDFASLSFRVRPPAYTGLRKAEDYDGGVGVLPVPVGGSVEVRGVADKSLRSAWIVINGSKVSPQMRINPNSPREAWGVFSVPKENRVITQVLQFSLQDTEGYASPLGRKQCLVQLRPDLPPLVEIRRHSVGAVLAPRAIIPVIVTAKDEYGLTVARVLVGRPLKDPNGQVMAEMKPNPNDPRENADPNQEIDLDSLKLQPGEVIRAWAVAEDNLPRDANGPNVGTSASLEFRIVKPEDLEDQLLRRQKELSLEFLQAIAVQDQARAKSEGAAEILADGIGPEAQRRAEDSGRLQVVVGTECAKAAETLQAILMEMKYNRVGTATNYNEMLEGTIQPLRELSRPIQDVTTALDRLNQAMKEPSADARKLRITAGEISELQKQLRVQMEDILKKMQKIENQRDLANKLKKLIDWSKELQDTIQTMRDRTVGNILESTTKPGAP
jgi:hypothetical protein